MSEFENNSRTIKRFLPWIFLTLSIIGNILQYSSYRTQSIQYKEQLRPEIECVYKYFAVENKYKLIIKNVSLVDCRDIWAQEKIFLIINDEVYEGVDVPHYNFAVYEDSRTRMWDLKKDKEIELDQIGYQLLSFEKLKNKFNPEIILKWNLSYSSISTSKRYQIDKYFIFDFNDRIFKEIETYVGGLSILNKIKDYLSFGSKQTVNIFDLTGDFEINAPKSYLINADYSFRPLYPWSQVTIDEFNKSLLFRKGILEIQPADDMEGSVYYAWKFEDEIWGKELIGIGKYRFVSKPFKLAFGYLPPYEATKVLQNPSLLKYYREDREKPKESIEEVLDKARIKYLEDKERFK